MRKKNYFFYFFCFVQIIFSFLYTQEFFEDIDVLSESFSVDEVVVEVESGLSKKKVISLLGIKPKDIIDARDIRDGFKELLETGAFAKLSIEIEETGSARKLVIKGVPNFKIGKILFVGNDFFGNFSLKKQADVSKYFDKVNLDAAASRIKEKYYKEGFIDVECTYKIQAQKEGKRDIVFIVDEGNRYIVRVFVFHGNKKVKSSKIIKRLSQKKKSFFGKGIFEKFNVEKNPQDIVFYYKTLGYIDVKVSPARYEFFWKKPQKKKVVYIKIHYDIVEGEKFYFGDYELRGNRFFSDEILTKYFGRKKGKTYNERIYQQDLQKMYTVYRDNGYLFARITPIEKIDREKKTVSHIFDIYEGNIAHIEKIFIQGLTKTKEFVVRRLLEIEEGEMFSTIALRDSIVRLNRLQYFSSVYPNVSLGTVEGLANLIFVVKEKSTIDATGGFSYSQNTGVVVNLRFTEKNFLNQGQHFSISGSYGLLTKSFQIAFFEPWVLGMPFGMGVQLSLSKNYRKYFTKLGSEPIRLPGSASDIVNKNKNSIFVTRDIINVRLLFSKTFLHWYSFQSSIFVEVVRDYLQKYCFFPERYSQWDIYQHNKSSFASPPPNENLINGGFKLSLERSTLDDELNPTRGSEAFASSQFTFGGYSFINWTLGYSNFYTPVSEPLPALSSKSSLIFGYSFQLKSLAYSLLGDFRYSEQNYYNFYENPSLMRGWDYFNTYKFRSDRFGSAGLVGDRLGAPLGQSLFRHLFEMHVPFPVDLFQFTMFVEMGNLSVEKIDFRSKSLSFLFDFKNMLYDAGVGFRLNLSMLPLRLYFSWRFIYDYSTKQLRLFEHSRDKRGAYMPEIVIDIGKKF